MKKCSKCKKTKSTEKFGAHFSGSDGLKSQCKKCRLDNTRTKNGLITKIYAAQRASSRSRDHSMPSYTKKWLSDWLLSNPEFHRLYDMWAISGYKKQYIPSVDRKNDSIGYVEYNIQLMTWAENKTKAEIDMRSGKLKTGKTPHKPVIKYTLEGDYVAEFVSASEAARQTTAYREAISNCCNNKSQTAGGYRWKFKKQ